MSVAFLNPWLWLGIGALAAPIWLHLRRRPESNIRRFSALQFLTDQPEPRRRPLRLRDGLLLALRLLALLALVAAFAWPYRPTADARVIKESRVYVLDNTLSHQAMGGFARDREKVAAEIAAAEHGLQIGVIELTAQPRVVVAFGDDPAAAAQKVRALVPSAQRGSYLAAFHQADTLLANSFGGRKRIVLCGDNQENQWTENQSAPPFLHGVEIELPKIGATQTPNLSLAEARVQRVFLGDKSLVSFSVQLTHTGPARTATVTLRAQGQTIFNRPVELANQPETIQLQAQWEADPKTWLRGDVTVVGEPDGLPADNQHFFCLPPLLEGKVALLAHSPYLRLALSPEIMRGQWATRVLEPAALGAELTGTIDADVLCLESNYLQSADARKLLARYLGNGRGVLLLINRVTPAINGYLRELGFEVESGGAGAGAAPGHIEYVAANHPIFHPFLAADFGNLTEVKVLEHAQVRAPAAQPLIISDKGQVLFFQGGKERRHLFVATFGFDRDQTTWPVHQTFIPFLDLALQTARAEDPTPTNFEPGEVGLVEFPVDTKVKLAILHDDQRELGRAEVMQGKARVLMPAQPGVYSLTYDSGTQVEKVFSVNPSPKESHLNFVATPGVLGSWQLPIAPTAPAAVPASGRMNVPLAGIWRQRFWWWFVVAGLAALLLETGMAELRKERV